MLRAVLPLFRAFLGRLGEGVASGPRVRSRARLEVTPLEDRCLLAQTLLWVAKADGNDFKFSTKANWADANGEAQQPPALNDTLIFDPSMTLGGKQGQDTDATDDIFGLSLTELRLASGYTSVVTLNNSLSTKKLLMSNGTITSAAGINLTITGEAGTSAFGGNNSSMAGAGSTIINKDATFHFNGDSTLEQRTLTNKGNIVWIARDINTDRATINNEGTFEIQTNSKIKHTGPPGGPFGLFQTVWDGKVTKTLGAGGIAEIQIPFHVASTLAAGVAAVTIKKDSGNLMLRGGGSNDFGTWLIEENTDTKIISRVYFAAGASTANYTWFAGSKLTGVGFYEVRENAKVYIADVNPAAAKPSVERLALDWGEITGDGELEISKELKWLAGQMTGGGLVAGKTTLLAGATANIGGDEYAGGPLILNQRVFDNKGTVNLKGNSSTNVLLEANDGAVINNIKDFYFLDDSDVKKITGAATSKFNNTGWLEKKGGDGWSEISTEYTEPKGFFRRSKGKFRFSGPKTSLLDGVFDANGGQVEVTGLFEQSGGSVLVSGAEAILSIASMATVSGGTVNVSLGGTFTASSGFAQSGGSISVMGYGSTLNVSGGYAQSGGTITVGGTGGKVSVYGSFVVSGGTFLIDNGLVVAMSEMEINSGGTLSVANFGGITGDVVNNGTITLAVAATLDITGDYTQSGTLNVLLGSASTYSRLNVSEVATLGGTLHVALSGGYMPAPMTSFTILTYGSHVGTFNTHQLPPLSFGVWQNPLLGYDIDDFTLRTLYF